MTELIETPSSPTLPSPPPEPVVKHRKVKVFILTALLYSTLHASRTAWAYTKPSLSTSLNLTDQALSLLDSSFLCAYAVGLYLSGWLGDRINPKKMLGYGMVTTVLCLGVIVLVLGHLGIPHMAIAITAFIFNGLGQSTGFPGCMALMSKWFQSKEKGLTFGVWLVNINIGNIVGQQIGKYCIDTWHLPWYYAHLAVGGLILLFTLLMLCILPDHPSDKHPKPVETSPEEPGSVFSFMEQTSGTVEVLLSDTSPRHILSPPGKKSSQRSIGFYEAWFEPGVLLYSLAYICVKSSLYGLLFWLPTYLKSDVGFQEETADLLAILEIGQLLGVLVLGFLSDRISNRTMLLTASLFFAFITFFGLSYLHFRDQINAFKCLLLIAGLFIGGPSGLIVSTVTIELSADKEGDAKNGHVKSTSTIIGIIDGSGTIGAALTQLAIPYIRHWCFLYYTGLCLAAAIFIPLAHRQIQRSRGKNLVKLDDAIEFTKTEPPTANTTLAEATIVLKAL